MAIYSIFAKFIRISIQILLVMEESKKFEVKNDSPKKAQRRRRRVTVAEKLMERKNRTNQQSGVPKQEKKSIKNGDNRGETVEKGRNTKHDGGIGQSNSEERKNAQRPFNSQIPDRWLSYPIAINQPIENTCFLAFKTPLGELFFDKQKFEDRQQHRFEVDTVIEHVNSLKKSLGLVIDLTNTNRYYDSGLWCKHKVQYVKIRCPGHEVNESEEFYQQFRKEVKQYNEQHTNSDKLVGVHCTHGLNRTGYLICRFLIEESGWSALNAIECFRIARGYPMERPKYIDSLKEAEKKMALLQVDGGRQ